MEFCTLSKWTVIEHARKMYYRNSPQYFTANTILDEACE